MSARAGQRHLSAGCRGAVATATALQPLSRAISPPAAQTSLCPRDLATLGFLAGFRCLEVEQLERLLDPARSLTPGARRRTALRALESLRGRGLAATPDDAPQGDRRARLVHRLTAHGRRVYGSVDARFPNERLRPPTQGQAAHARLVADLAVTIHGTIAQVAADTGMAWESDWEAVARVGSMVVIPDALLTYEVARRRTYAFIEADRANEYDAAFGRKVERYLRLYRSDTWRDILPIWPFVLTVTTTPGQASRLKRTTVRAVSRSDCSALMARFRFTSLSQVHGPLGFLGAIWQVAGRDGLHRPIDPRDDDRRAAQVATAQSCGR